MKKRARRQHFTQGTLGRKPKVGYSQADAERLAAHEGKCAYHCKCCGKWHIGGTAPKKNLTNKNAPALLEQPGA